MQSPVRAFKAEVFQALAHPTRIAIIDALRGGEAGTSALLARVPVGQANLSQHLAILRARRIVVSRKVGNQTYYSIRHPVLLEVLDLLKQYFNAHLKEIVGMLDESRLRGRTSRRA
jgi:DNA-binding transcriptional ArsR family regulator